MIVVPSITYVMAAHDAESFIAASIESLIDQQGPPSRIIVVDDASQDGTRSIAERFKPHVDLLLNEGIPLGPAGARNLALERVTSDWVAVQDADDVASVGRSEAYRVAIAANPDRALWYGDVDFIDAQGKQTVNAQGSLTYGTREFDLLSLLKGNFIAHPSVCFRRMFKGRAIRYRSDLLAMEDWDLYLRLAFMGASFGAIKTTLSSYRLHGGGMSRSAQYFRLMGRMQWFKLSNIFRWHGVPWAVRLRLGLSFLAVALRRFLPPRS